MLISVALRTRSAQAVYGLEMCIRIIAMGFWPYLSDYWNQLDFVVSATGLFSLAADLVSSRSNGESGKGLNLRVLRTFRVMRPLRFMKRLAGMRVVMASCAAAIPELTAVLGLCLFLFVLFGIMAVQLFGGVVHARCRLTPFPVTRDWTSGADPFAFRCLEGADTFSTTASHPAWSKDDSPWSKPQVIKLFMYIR